MTVFRIASTLVVALTVFVWVGCGGGAATRNVTAAQAQVSFTISPRNATVPVGTTQPFVASVLGATPKAPVQWSASAGTIDQSGNYIAPTTVPIGGTATVIAKGALSPPLSASATVTITSGPVTVSVSPQMTTLKAGFSQQYTANVDGTTNTGVTWSANDLSGDNTFPGLMSGSVYSAPAPLLNTHTYSITAVSSADPTRSGSSSVTVIPLENEEEQVFPIKLGASGINADVGDCCAGTLGSLLQDKSGKQYILSNNHVVGRLGHASVGEAIVQPGYVDTFCNLSLPNTVAHFTAAAPITTTNVDAAIAEVVPGAVDPQGEIIGLGGIASDGSYIPAPPAASTVKATIGMSVAKSGRTTGLSCSSVEAVDADVSIDYPADCGNTTAMTVGFRGQLMMGSLIQHGDSGSLIVDAATSQPLGLVVGISSDGRLTTANPINEVLAALNASTGLQLSFVGGAQHPVSCSSAAANEQGQASRENQAVGPSFAQLSSDEISRAITVKRRYSDQIMKQPAVRAVAVGAGKTPGHAAVLVYVEAGKSASIPATLDGFEVRMIHSGRFKAAGASGDFGRARCSLHKSVRVPLRSGQTPP